MFSTTTTARGQRDCAINKCQMTAQANKGGSLESRGKIGVKKRWRNEKKAPVMKNRWVGKGTAVSWKHGRFYIQEE